MEEEEEQQQQQQQQLYRCGRCEDKREHEITHQMKLKLTFEAQGCKRVALKIIMSVIYRYNIPNSLVHICAA